MATKIHKIFTNYEKEEEWLNKMASIGLMLVNYKFATYYFEKGNPGEYTYRLEFLDYPPKSSESLNYIEFMKDLDIEHIASSSNWVYFRRKSDKGKFDLFSDIESRINHYKKLIKLYSVIFLLNVIASLNIIFSTNILFYLNFIIVLLFLPILHGSYKKIKLLENEKKLME